MSRYLVVGLVSAFTVGLVGLGHANAKRLDPKAVYAMPVAGSASHGPGHALVTIVEVFDFACHHCKKASATMTKVRKLYGKKVRFVYKNMIVYKKRSTNAALAGCAAYLSGAFKPMYDRIFSDQRNMTLPTLHRYAAELGLDKKRFARDLKTCTSRISHERGQVSAFGVRGTPAFFINGRYLGGNRPLKQFTTLIDEELKKAKQIVGQGMPVAKYYDEMVIKRGRKKP